MNASVTDYRHSHKAADKPASYNAQFSERNNVKALYWKLEQQVLDSVLPSAEQANRSLLDFACGTGRVLAYLQQRFRRSVGLDISEAMLGEAQQHVDAEFLVGDVTNGEIQMDHRPDVITAFRFFLNAQPSLRTEVLSWIHQNLADDGTLVCNFHLNPNSLVGMSMNTMKRLRGWKTTPMLSVRGAKDLLEANSFKVKRVIGYGFLYYGQARIWAPMSALLTFESLLARCGAFRSVSRNFLVVAEKQ